MADRREVTDDPVEAMRVALQGFQAEIWTALPGIIESFDPVKMTVRVQPAVKARVFSHDDNPPLPGAVLEADNWWNVPLPLLVDVPVMFPGGGGFTMTFPVVAGDEALVVFSSRSIDNWWYQGGVQNQSVLALHDLSDGFAFVGVRSQPRVLTPAVSATAVAIRSDDNTVHIKIAAGEIEIIAPAIKLGTTLKKLVTEDAVAIFNAHVHSGVQTGGGNSGGPTTTLGAGQLTSVTKAE